MLFGKVGDIDDDFGGGEESEWMVGREPSSGEESE